MRTLRFKKHTSVFKTPGGTSRGVLHTKDSWIIKVWDNDRPEIIGTGEVSIIEGLSLELPRKIEDKLKWLSDHFEQSDEDIFNKLRNYPAIRFGLECALLDLKKGGNNLLFESDFTAGKQAIPINGLIWMGSFEEMRDRIYEKLEEGFGCLKLKIGAITFEKELHLLSQIRKEFSPEKIELRVDANGAFQPQNAERKLKSLAEFALHSIEQPIRQGQWKHMADLCRLNIVPIALDEELIGVHDRKERIKLLDTIKPQYIILKPSLLGGFSSSDEWIELAQERNIGWWATSALETNIGLNAIAQWVAAKNTDMPQGLGTGQLFTNNFSSKLDISKGELWLKA